MIYFNKLVEFVQQGVGEFRLVIAPPRSNSTLLEHCLGQSEDVDLEIHEPFVGARLEEFEAEDAYKFIYDSIVSNVLPKKDKRWCVLIKEMSHWIMKSDEYTRLFSLTNSPIIFAIRNPLLCVESRMRKTIESLDKKCRSHTVQWMLNRIAEEHDLKNWHRLVTYADTQNYNTRHLHFLSEFTDLRKVYDRPNDSIQAAILDYRAQMIGFVNWRDLVEHKFHVDRDYEYFGNFRELYTCLTQQI